MIGGTGRKTTVRSQTEANGCVPYQKFKKKFFQVIGEERGAAFLDCLYKYLREEPDSEGTAVKGATSATPSPEVSMGPSMTIAKPATPESEPQPSPA